MDHPGSVGFMPHPKHDRRPHVIEKAAANGWSHQHQETQFGAISDLFTRGPQTLTCHWVQTPWSDARWAIAVFAGVEGPRLVWKIEGKGGVLAVLAGR